MLILLSPNNSVSEIISSFSLLINCQIYIAFFAAYPSTIYSALVVKVDTVFCFVLLHKITVSLREKLYLMTDVQSLKSSAKLLFTQPNKPYGVGSLRGVPSAFLPYIKPNYMIPFKY